MIRAWPRAWVLALALLAIAPRARAQASDEPTTIDTVRGTIQGSTRFIGLGGAFVAIADDTEGVPINPASTAVRQPYSWSSFSWAFGVEFSIATWLPKNDIYNEPESSESGDGGTLFGSVAAVVNFRHWGFGLSAEAEQNTVSQGTQGVTREKTANFGLVHLNAAHGYFDGQLQLGAGLRVVGLSYEGGQGAGNLGASGLGYTAGMIIKPNGAPFRLGAAVEQPIDAKIEGDPGTEPIIVHVPWRMAFGFAFQFGTRKLNRPFVTVADRVRQNTKGREPTSEDADKAAKQLYDEYMEDQTWYLLLCTELALLEGARDEALGTYDAVDRPLYSPRVGLESEVVPRFLRLRTGSYLELPVAEEGEARLHGTVGGDIKLFRWGVFGLVSPFDWWQLSVAADIAKSYLNTSFTVGFWH
jgi:hypothetical protein